MDWKEPAPLQPELKFLLEFLVSISKEDRLAHVILATSDYFLANWLTDGKLCCFYCLDFWSKITNRLFPFPLQLG
jgi:hypothetical protein